MLSLELYICAAAAIASETTAPEEAVSRLSAREPDYSGIIPPMQLRRMSKAVRMGIGAAHACLQSAAIKKPDAIAVGTALGCLTDTEAFLRKMVRQDEQMLTPTAFIQSTHNTVAGQIALGTGCHGYNNTIVQQGHSFEGSVVSAALHLIEHPLENTLCGGVDELTDTAQWLMQRVGVYTSRAYPPDDMKSTHYGVIAGEGAGFLLLSKDANNAVLRINGIELFTEPATDIIARRIQQTIDTQGGLRNTDLLLIGATGDVRFEAAYASPIDQGMRYRQNTGAWGTDTAVAIARLVNNWPEGKTRAWVISNWGQDWCIWLLERV